MKFYDKNGRVHDKWILALWSNLTTHKNIRQDVYSTYVDRTEYEDDKLSDVTAEVFNPSKRYQCSCGNVVVDSTDNDVMCDICGTIANIPLEE